MTGTCRGARCALSAVSLVALAGAAFGQVAATDSVAKTNKIDSANESSHLTQNMELMVGRKIERVAADPDAPFVAPRGIGCASLPDTGTVVSTLAAFDDLAGNVPPTTIGPQRIVDNFEVDADSTLSSVTFQGTYFDNIADPGQTFRITVYNDAGGYADSASIVETVTGGVSSAPVDTGVDSVAGNRLWEFTVPFAGTSAVTANTCYWIEIVDDAVDSTGWSWATTTIDLQDDLRGFARFDATQAWGALDLATGLDVAFCISTAANADANDQAALAVCADIPAGPVCTADINALGSPCQSIDAFSGQGFQTIGPGGLRLADNFVPSAGNTSITEVCVAGFYVGGQDLDTNPNAFEIRIYGDNGGRPDGVPDGSGQIGATITSASESLFLNPVTNLFEFSFDISASPITLPAADGTICYWIEVINVKAGNPFVWIGSQDGDGLVGMDGIFVGTASGDGYSFDEILNMPTIFTGATITDFSFCLNGPIEVGDACPTLLPPANDFCTTAAPIAAASTAGQTATATVTRYAPACGFVGADQADVYYSISSPVTQTVTLSTDDPGTDFDTTIRVYCGADCDDLNCLASNDDAEGGPTQPGTSTVSFVANAGETYLVNVSGFGGVGALPGVGFFTLLTTLDPNTPDPSVCEAQCEVTHAHQIETAGDCINDVVFSVGCDDPRSGVINLGTDTGASGWLRASGGSRDGDTWTLSLATAATVEFDFDVESPTFFDLFDNATQPCAGTDVSVLGGAAVIAQNCDAAPELAIALPAGEYYFLLVPLYFSGGNCEDEGTEYNIAVGAAITGACCFTDGSCIETSVGVCDANNGAYDGDGTACGSCPQPGACCIDVKIGDTCVDVLEDTCNTLGGQFQGEGTQCYLAAGAFQDFPSGALGAPISDLNVGGETTASVVVGTDFTVGDVEVVVNITHTWNGDLTISLSAPTGETAILYDQACNAAQEMDIAATFTDAGDPGAVCATPLSGFLLPVDGLADTFNGVSSAGNWTLTVVDNAAGDDGTLDNFTVRLDERLDDGAANCGTDNCPCDQNGSGGVDVSDLLAFLALWFPDQQNNPPPFVGFRSDYNEDGIYSSLDLLAFLACWFPLNGNACP